MKLSNFFFSLLKFFKTAKMFLLYRHLLLLHSLKILFTEKTKLYYFQAITNNHPNHLSLCDKE